MSRTLLPAPISVLPNMDNPFECALLEGACLTYISLSQAGLGEKFDPLPCSNGIYLASLAIQPSARLGAAKLCDELLKLGANPVAPHAMPDRLDSTRHAPSGSYDYASEPAPLASIAIASQIAEFDSLWNRLDAKDFLAISPTALPWAFSAEKLDAAKALLDAGADPGAKDELQWPAFSHCKNAQSLALALEKGANLRAPVGKNCHRKDCQTIADYFMSDSSLSSEPKAMRELCASWLAAHPSIDGEDLARAAFKAIKEDNRDSARRCVLAMGEKAPLMRDSFGDSLLVAATAACNYPEAKRLMSLGANPFEIMPSGLCAYAIGHENETQHLSNSCYAWVELEKTISFNQAVLKTRKTFGFDWRTLGPGGHCMVECLIGKVSPQKFFGLLHTAVSLGWNLDENFSSGMNLACTLALLLAKKAPAIGFPSPNRWQLGFYDTSSNEACIQEARTLACGKALAPEHAQALLLALTAEDSTSLKNSVFGELSRNFFISEEPDTVYARKLAASGAEALGASGMALPDFPKEPAYSFPMAGLHEFLNGLKTAHAEGVGSAIDKAVGPARADGKPAARL